MRQLQQVTRTVLVSTSPFINTNLPCIFQPKLFAARHTIHMASPRQRLSQGLQAAINSPGYRLAWLVNQRIRNTDEDLSCAVASLNENAWTVAKLRQADSKKRAREESEEEDDEPVSNKRNAKKARQSKKSDSSTEAPSKVQKKATTAKGGASSSKSKAKAKHEDVDEEVTEQPASPKKATKSKAKAKKDESKAPEQPASPPKVTAKKVDAEVSPADPAAAESEKEDEDLVSSEDEKPAAKVKAAKAREKVQSTLKSGDGELYPDWKAGEPVPYAALCAAFSKIEMTTKRLEISAYCAKFFRQVLRLTPDDLLPTVLLMVNKLAADYAGIELGIGESLIMKSIGETTGRSLAVIKADQTEIGDLGLVAAKSRSNQPTMFKPKPLTVRGVHKGLIEIATIEGQGSQGRKVASIKKLLSASDAHLTGKGGKGVDILKDKGGPSEAKFIVRMLEGKLRLGLADKSVLVSLAHAMVAYELDPTGKKVPNTEQLAKGERTLKSVYRSVLPTLEMVYPSHSLAVNFLATKSSSPQCLNTVCPT